MYDLTIRLNNIFDKASMDRTPSMGYGERSQTSLSQLGAKKGGKEKTGAFLFSPSRGSPRFVTSLFTLIPNWRLVHSLLKSAGTLG